jgi:selenide,water dikinase
VLPGTLDLLGEGVMAGGLGRNRQFYTAQPDGVSIDDTADPLRAQLAFDPQTSGGLLFAVPADTADRLMAAFASAGEPIWRIGEVTSDAGVTLRGGTS